MLILENIWIGGEHQVEEELPGAPFRLALHLALHASSSIYKIIMIVHSNRAAIID